MTFIYVGAGSFDDYKSIFEERYSKNELMSISLNDVQGLYDFSEDPIEEDTVVIAELNQFIMNPELAYPFFECLNNLARSGSRVFAYFSFGRVDSFFHDSIFKLYNNAGLDHCDFYLNSKHLITPVFKKDYFNDKQVLFGLFNYLRGGATTYKDAWYVPFSSEKSSEKAKRPFEILPNNMVEKK